MADLRTFKCTWADSWDIQLFLLVDFDILTPERASEINAFWTEADFRQAMCDGDARAAVVRSAAAFLMQYAIENPGSRTEHLTAALHDAEGWGDHTYNGISVKDFDELPVVVFDTVEIEEVENG
jgi:hypothetical protein